MGKYEGESSGNASSNFRILSSQFDDIAAKCAVNSAAAVAAAAAICDAILCSTGSATSSATDAARPTTAITKHRAITNSAKQTRRANKNLGQCIVKRGWWSR